MAFQFSLAAVLRVRGIIEEREEGKLQRILFDLAKILDDLERIDAQLHQSEVVRHAAALKPCLGLHLHAFYGEMQQLKERRRECETQIRKLQVARDAQLIVYEAARRDREMLTDMREEKRTAYEAEASKRAQSILDDIHIARRVRS